MVRPVDSPIQRGSHWPMEGKDRHPFPVPLRVYDETIRTLKSASKTRGLGDERNSVHLSDLINRQDS